MQSLKVLSSLDVEWLHLIVPWQLASWSHTCCLNLIVLLATDGVHCNLPLGMSTGFISSAQITASGSLSTSYNKDAARLLRAVHPIFGWSPRTNNNQQYIQVDLRAVTKVTGVATQGRGNADQWVTSYKLRCSQNGVTWVTYQEHGSDKVCFAVDL